MAPGSTSRARRADTGIAGLRRGGGTKLPASSPGQQLSIQPLQATSRAGPTATVAAAVADDVPDRHVPAPDEWSARSPGHSESGRARPEQSARSSWPRRAGPRGCWSRYALVKGNGHDIVVIPRPRGAQSGGGSSAAGSPWTVCHATAVSTMIAPAIAKLDGRSSRKIRTQTGFATGSIMPMSDASVAVT